MTAIADESNCPPVAERDGSETDATVQLSLEEEEAMTREIVDVCSNHGYFVGSPQLQTALRGAGLEQVFDRMHRKMQEDFEINRQRRAEQKAREYADLLRVELNGCSDEKLLTKLLDEHDEDEPARRVVAEELQALHQRRIAENELGRPPMAGPPASH